MLRVVIRICYGVRASVPHTRLETESVRLSLDSGRCLSLNSVGSRICNRLAGRPSPPQELFAGIEEEYEASREIASGNRLEPRDP